MAVETITNAEEFLQQTALDINPQGDFRSGTAIFDLLIEPISKILQPVLDDIADIARRQSLARLNDLSETDMDELVANVFVTRRGGSKAQGTARIFFNEPISFAVASGTAFISSQGLRFIAEREQTITSQAMSLNISGDFFFFDVDIASESEGEQFNIAANDLIDILLPDESITLVDNLSAFSQGVERETNEQLFARAVLAITTRDLVTEPGISTVLLEQFTFIRNLESVGFGDVEMIRDELIGSNLSIGGRTFSDANKINIGGKVDIYLQIDTRTSKTVDIDPANIRNRLRTRDTLDSETPASDEIFVVPGGLVDSVATVGVDTQITSSDLDLVINELAGKAIKFTSGNENRKTFKILSNGTNNILLSGEVDVSVNDEFQVTDVIILPILRILKIEEIDPATKDGIGVFLVANEDFVFDVETPSIRLSDSERVTLTLLDFDGTVNSIETTLGLNTIITDTSLSLTPNSLNGKIMRMLDGSAFNEEFVIITNTATTITVTGDITAKVSTSDKFAVLGGSNVGRSFRVTYETQSRISEVQDFMLLPANRVVTADLLTKSSNNILIDISISLALSAAASVTLDTSAVQTAIEDYINKTLGFSSDLEVADIIDLIFETVGASRDELKIRLPITINSEKITIDGQTITESTQDALSSDRTEIFVPRTITVTEI